MEIVAQTKNLLNNIVVHDSEFSGYSYDYDNRKIIMRCRNIITHKNMEFVFENVIISHLQSCSFWGDGYNIMWMKASEDNEYLDQLRQIQEKNQDSFWGSYLDKGINFFSIEFTINSGDILLIVCQKVIYTDESF